MKKLLFFSFIIAVVVSVAGITGCSKDDDEPEVETYNIIVSAITPDTGPYSTIVTITGSGFSAAPTENTVRFNGKAAVVQSATATQIIAVVPAAAGTGVVTVQRGSSTGIGPVFNFINTITVSTLAGSGIPGFADGIGSTAQFSYPRGVAVDAQGNVYVADYSNSRIRKITPAGAVSTLAGGSPGFADGNGASAQFNNPAGVAVDAQGNIYVADCFNHRIRKITTAGVVSTLAGNSTNGFADGNGSSALFNAPRGVALDAQGNIYVADADNHRIRKITPAGVVSTMAGNGNAGYADGNSTSAEFSFPRGVSVDAQGNIIVADQDNHRIRKITPTGVVSTIAGNGILGFADGTGTAAQFRYPGSVAVDTQGNVYVADINNQRIRKITSAGVVSTLAGNGTLGFADGSGTLAQFYYPVSVDLDAQGNIYVADQDNNRIRKITIE